MIYKTLGVTAIACFFVSCNKSKLQNPHIVINECHDTAYYGYHSYSPIDGFDEMYVDDKMTRISGEIDSVRWKNCDTGIVYYWGEIRDHDSGKHHFIFKEKIPTKY